MEDKPADAPKVGMKACRRCRMLVIAVLLAVAGGLIWWQAGKQGDGATPLPARSSGMLPKAPGGAAEPQLPGLDVMVAKLAQRLEKEPKDGEGWALLARTYLELGELDKADAAFAKALALRPDDATMKADYLAARKALGQRSP